MIHPGPRASRQNDDVDLKTKSVRSVPVYFSRKASVEASRRRANLGSGPASEASRAECDSTRSDAGEEAHPRQHRSDSDVALPPAEAYPPF